MAQVALCHWLSERCRSFLLSFSLFAHPYQTMVLSSRLEFLEQRASAGNLLTCSILPNRHSGNFKVKVLLRQHEETTSGFIRSAALSSIAFIRSLLCSCSVVDRGHKHSDGTMEVCFWAKQVSQEAALSPANVGVSSDPSTTNVDLIGAWVPLIPDQTLHSYRNAMLPKRRSSNASATLSAVPGSSPTLYATQRCDHADVGVVTQDIDFAQRWCALASSLASHSRSLAVVYGRLLGLHLQMQRFNATMEAQNHHLAASEEHRPSSG